MVIMAAWINVTPQLRKGLNVINRIDSGKLRLLVNRICQSLHTRNEADTFTSDEKEKLSVSLDLNQNDLILLLDTVTLIYTQAAFHMVKPISMESYMKETFNIEDARIDVISHAWSTHANGIVDTLRQKSIFPLQVDEINWRLNIQSSSMAISTDMRPTVLMSLGLNDTSKKKCKSSVTVEMDKSSLSQLYHNLETIQCQLDSLK